VSASYKEEHVAESSEIRNREPHMAKIHKWWQGRASERVWLEVTRRPDLGANLKAPQRDEHDKEFWSYALVREVNDGDVVFHYDGNAMAIVGRSVATGVWWQDEIIWAARGSSAREAQVVPHARPGWYFGLEQYERLAVPITLEAIREKEDAMQSLTASLRDEVGKPLYFPFELGTKRPVRPMQGYLFKLPVAFLELFGLEVAPATGAATVPVPSVPTLGDDYRPADELVAPATRDPFAVDPALVERGVRGHATTQNALAAHIKSAGLEPRSPNAGEPNFDVAWLVGSKIFVAEVKSLTAKNEEKQLRLGLGQVLRYADQLGGGLHRAPVLAVEREPMDSSWLILCEKLGVLLVWPEVFAKKLPLL
jgi:hypothetical protein